MPLRAPVRIGVAGALGRMGRALTRAVNEAEGLEIGALFDRPGTEGESCDGATLTTAAQALDASDVILDFTLATASAALASLAAAHGGVALIIGSTGFTAAEEAPVLEASRTLAIVKTTNFSLGVNILAGLVAQAAQRLDPKDWDAEVFEAHHRRKIDAPSGTALTLGQAVAGARGVDLAKVAVRARDGITGARETGAIGFSVMRGGGIVGEHSVVFAAEDEIITFSHSARDRSLFARGAVAAAAWVPGRPPGLYDMRHVLGFADV